jgi:hypothetical protein
VGVSTVPDWLPRYQVDVHLDIPRRTATGTLRATWINPTDQPTNRLVFNAHSRFVVPSDQQMLMAKMLEILRVPPSESLGYTDPPLEVHSVRLVTTNGTQSLPFAYEGDTKTTLALTLPNTIGPRESVTVLLDFTVRIPAKQGRWGQWEGVTCLVNWLPVFAYYGTQRFGPAGKDCDAPKPIAWQPVPFIPWHQPFLNEAGLYDVSVTLPVDQEIASTGHVVAETKLPNNFRKVQLKAVAVRDFALIVSDRFRLYLGEAKAGPGGAPVKVRIVAFEEHHHHAKEMIRISIDALETYAKQLGPYPWPEFTVAETFFGWNGNECSNLVMIDQRVFGMPSFGTSYVESLLTHEVCHQWFYNLIGTNGYCETWMDEALCNYLCHRNLNKKDRFNNLLQYPKGFEWVPNIRREDYRSAGMYGTFGRGENGPVIQEMSKFGHLANLFNLCYDKGGRIVGTIEQRLGETAFLDFLRIIVSKYRYRVMGVCDFRRELESYTGRSWKEFFEQWLYGDGLSDWAIEKVDVTRPPQRSGDPCKWCILKKRLLLCRGARPDEPEIPPGGVRLQVTVVQKGGINEPTALGIAMPGCEGYPIRIPLQPGASSYNLDEPRAVVTPIEPTETGGARFLVDVVLGAEPTQVAVDPDQVLVDTEPSNNHWHTPIRWRLTPLYTYLDETDLTNAWDRWNIIAGPWIFAPPYETAWFTRSTMIGFRAGCYRTQQFNGGVYTAYRSTFRDVVTGVDGTWDHWPHPKMQTGFIAERRLAELNNGDQDALRAAIWGRYVFLYGASMYLPPIHSLEAYAQYSDNFLPQSTQTVASSIRYDRTSVLGLHYHLNLLTPYWDPENGVALDAWYEGGIAQKPSTVGLHKVAGQLSYVHSFSWLGEFEQGGMVQRGLDWFSETRLALRAYGATAAPSKGEFYSMGGGELFRGFDLAQRQGSTVWVGSVEWRVPLAKRVNADVLDHIACVKNLWAALFYDVGDTYANGQSVGPVAHGVGIGLRMDVAWLSFVERTTLRLDVAKAINSDTGVQVWVGLNHPF